MSDFKIIGNASPVVGVVEHYTLDNLYSKISLDPNFNIGNTTSLPQIKWEVHVLELGKWRKTKENDKTGNQVTYKFRHGSLTRAGIRIVAIKGNERAQLDIKPLAAKPKIDDVRLLDRNGKKIEGRLSYGQTVKARVHCLHMEKLRVYVTLWEDDIKGAGHNKANETNFIETRSGIVRDGIVDVDFLLKPSFAKIAEKGGPENDKIHEYYVTAQLAQEKVPSNNVNVNAPEAPVAPYKAKTTPKQPVKINKPQPQPKPEPVKPNTPSVPAVVKGKINSVNLTDTAGHKIIGTFKEKQIKVWINSTDLVGKEIRLKLYDEDLYSNDELLNQTYIIKSNLYAIVVSLDTIPRSLGGNYLQEGAEQELFAEVEVIQNHVFTKSAVVDVDAQVFKQDTFEIFNKVLKVVMGNKENDEGNCGEKYCITKDSPESELIREINIRLAGFGGNIPTDKFTDRTEKMIKQFQRDYMKVPETGKVCGNVLRAIDEFSNKWSEKILTYKCLCHASDSNVESKNRCSGYGKGEKNEHPGMHRTILWGVSALKFYLSQQKTYKYSYTSAGYRCWAHNRSIPRKTTNHMGKAVDIHFINGSTRMDGKNKSNITHLKEVRDKFYIKYLKAEEGWTIPSKIDNYRLEPIGMGKDESFSWVHLDVSLFKTEFLKDAFFVKQQNLVIGKSIVQLANELGFKDTCNCNKINLKTNDNKNSSVNCQTCMVMDKPRMDFYKQFGDASIELVKSKAKSNKFKGLYMVAQRRQENSFALEVPNNNPMNIKGLGDLGSKDIDTHEHINGKKIYMKDKFANFSTVERGFEGYLKQLDKNFTYAYNAILDDSKTIDDFLNGMQDTGKLGPYATDPNYKKLIKILFHGVVSDYKKWLNCKLTCSSHSSEVEKIKADIKLLEKLE